MLHTQRVRTVQMSVAEDMNARLGCGSHGGAGSVRLRCVLYLGRSVMARQQLSIGERKRASVQLLQLLAHYDMASATLVRISTRMTVPTTPSRSSSMDSIVARLIPPIPKTPIAMGQGTTARSWISPTYSFCVEATAII